MSRPPVSGEPPMGADKRRWERDPEYRASLFPEPCLSCENSVARHCPECRACPTGPSSFDCTCRPPVSREPRRKCAECGLPMCLCSGDRCCDCYPVSERRASTGAALDVLRDLYEWASRMPDAALTEGDPRFDWWNEGAEVRRRAAARLAEQSDV